MANEKKKAGSYKAAFTMLLLFGPALLLIFISTRGCEHKFKKLDDYGRVPNFEFKTLILMFLLSGIKCTR
jgi:hypothetical protein